MMRRVERGDGFVQHRAVGVVHRALPANARRTIAFNAFDGGNRAITAKPVREAHAVDGKCKRLFATSGEFAVGMAGDVHGMQWRARRRGRPHWWERPVRSSERRDGNEWGRWGSTRWSS